MLAYSFVVLVLTGAGLVLAQSLPVILTPSCSSVLRGLLASHDAECLGLGSFLPFVINPNRSIPQTVNNWLIGICGNKSCTDSNIANVVGSLTQSCAEDFSNIGIETAGLKDQIISSVQQAYPTIRQVACLQDTTTNEFCVTQTLRNVEKSFGNLVVGGNLTIDTLNQDVQTFLNSNLTHIACTNCAKAAYNIGMTDFSAEVSQADPTLKIACGSTFLDRNNTTDVSQTALLKRSSVYFVNTNSGSSYELFTLVSHGLIALLSASVFLV